MTDPQTGVVPRSARARNPERGVESSPVGKSRVRKERKEAGARKRIRWNEDDACSANPPLESRAYQGHCVRTSHAPLRTEAEKYTRFVYRLDASRNRSFQDPVKFRGSRLDSYYSASKFQSIDRDCSHGYLWRHRKKMYTRYHEF